MCNANKLVDHFPQETETIETTKDTTTPIATTATVTKTTTTWAIIVCHPTL